MLDILVPTLAANQALVPDAIRCIQKCTDLMFRLVVIVDGGIRADLAELEQFMSTYQGQWQLLHNPVAVGLNQTLREGLEICPQKMVAVIAPHVRLDDSGWFGKVQQIFNRDPTCCIVDTSPNTKSATLYPIKRSHTHPVSAGCRFAVLNASFAKGKLPFGNVDPMTHWSRAAVASGGSSWAAPGVRYHHVEHQEHDLWREPLASQSPSGSRSPTTRG